MGKFDRVLLAADYDNTLVDTRGMMERGLPMPEMSPRNREALAYFTENGGLFAVSTGRALGAFQAHAALLPLNAPCVLATGAALYDFSRQRYLITYFFTDAIYHHMEDVLARFPTVGFEVYHDDRRIHAMHDNAFIQTHQHLTRSPAEFVQDFREIDLPIVKVLFEEETAELETVRDYIRTLPWSGEYELALSSEHLLEMTVRGATKGNMVLRLAELLGVARQDLYCIGDHANDIPMLDVSAIPFAPSNCIDALRQYGAQIVGSCRDGAVADVIEILDRRYGAR